jgi:enoyl-CoA hydratase
MNEGGEKIIISEKGRLGLFRLNRPKALNALDGDMLEALRDGLARMGAERRIYAVVTEAAGGRAFCAGADVRHLREVGMKDPRAACDFFRLEYGYNWRLACFAKPHVALMNGIVMGGGAGISVHGTHRVAGENFSFAMPETLIGLFPDVGATRFLSHLPNSVGLYLGLTGRSISRDDAFRLGLVTHLIDSEHFPAIREALAEGEPVDALLDDLHEEPGKGELGARHGWIEAMFSPARLEEIFRLGRKLEDDSDGWTGEVVAELEKRSPTSLALTLALWKKGRALNLRSALELEFAAACNLMEGGEFFEGVRAQLVDKDKKPQWSPASISELDGELIAALLEPRHGRLGLEEAQI